MPDNKKLIAFLVYTSLLLCMQPFNYPPPAQHNFPTVVPQQPMPKDLGPLSVNHPIVPLDRMTPQSPVLIIQNQQRPNENQQQKQVSKVTPVDRITTIDPSLGKKLREIFEYNGIVPPWNHLRDFEDQNQQNMPDPCMLYVKMKDILKVFESLKEMISDELLKIETYVKRAKSYLKEDQERLERNLEKMKKYLRKIRCAKTLSNKQEYAEKFKQIHEDTKSTVAAFQKLKNWLTKTLSYFKMLF